VPSLERPRPAPERSTAATVHEVVAALTEAGGSTPAPLGLYVAGGQVALAGSGQTWLVETREPAATVATVEQACSPRWVVWDCARDMGALVAAGVRLAACWDLAAVHRLINGGWVSDPAHVWATAAGLAAGGIPQSGQLDLLSLGPSSEHRPPPSGGAGRDPGDPDDPVGEDGYLRPGCWEAVWLARTPRRAARWAELACWVMERQVAQLSDRSLVAAGGDARTTARSESAAALLSVELERVGLPLDVAEAERVIAGFIGPRPVDDRAKLAARQRRDAAVLGLARSAHTDLRNPAQVRQLLADVGVDLPDTRSWRLEPFRGAHPLVDALLQWRKAERMETTYGYTWLDRQVTDGRLRGQWQASDGAAGRMTAQAGLHNLPAELRPAVVAPLGHALVRADLGQIEPRVLAAVSRDEALAAAATEADLYAPVAARLGVDRPTAKVAVLAAMYGQTSGAAGAALKGMDASYPRAMAYLRAADEAGRAGHAVTTYGGRRVPVWAVAAAGEESQDRAAAAARGRFTRNAVIQGAAAELFKAWAATVRLAVAGSGARIVLCLHDELLVEAPLDAADEVAAALHRTLDATAARWFGSGRVRFVADVRVLQRWSDAKD
jgi:DNA polymerase-1